MNDNTNTGVWKFSSNGQYDTKSAYELACRQNPKANDKDWQWLWKTAKSLTFFRFAAMKGLPLLVYLNIEAWIYIDPIAQFAMIRLRMYCISLRSAS